MDRRLGASLALVLVAAGCGDDGALPDAGDASAPDAPADGGTPVDADPGPLAVALRGEPLAYLDADACFTAEHNGGEGAVLTFVWGDGEREMQSAPDACHRFRYPGELLVSVVVEARAMSADAALVVTVVPRPADPLPTASSPILHDAARGLIWVVNPDADSIALLDADPPALLSELPACDRPRTLALDGDRLAVTCQGSGELLLVDAADRSVAGRIPLGDGSEPYGVTADPRGGRFFVTLLGAGALAVVEDDVVARLDVGPDPRGVAARGDGTVLVTRWRGAADGSRVHQIDAADPRAPRLAGTALFPPDVGIDSDTDNSGVLSFLNQVVFSPDGGRALLPATKANNQTGLFRSSTTLTSQTTARAVLGEVMLRSGRPLEESFRFSFDDLDVASAAVFSAEGARLYVAFQGAQRVVAVDAFGFNSVGSISGVGIAPQGLALGANDRLLYVQAFLSRSVRVYDVTDLSREPSLVAEVSTVAREPLAPDVLAGIRVFYTSRDPRMSRTSYLSCASCHLDGEADGLVWDFTQRGEGLRNTIPLRGRGGVGDGPLHWSANFDEVQDFEHDIRNGQGGTGFLSDDVFHVGTRDTPLGDPKAGLSVELDGLAAYLGSLADIGTSPHRRSGDAAWEASHARGEAIFASAGCATCHVPPRFTDSGFVAGAPVLHDVGTLGAGSGERLGEPLTGLDTPTLHGLWRSAPYLHDGSAATVEDVLVARNPTDTHGRTSDLDEAELADLVTYLMSIDDREP